MFIVHFNQVFVKCIKSLLCVSSSANFIPAYVAHGMAKNIFVLRTIQPFIYICIFFLDFHLLGNMKHSFIDIFKKGKIRIKEYSLGTTKKVFLLNDEIRNVNTSSRPIIVFRFRRPFLAKNLNQRPQVMNLQLSWYEMGGQYGYSHCLNQRWHIYSW